MCKDYAAKFKGRPVSFKKGECYEDQKGKIKVVINGGGEHSGAHVNFFDLNFPSKGEKDKTLREIKKRLDHKANEAIEKKPALKKRQQPIRRNLVVC